VSGAPASECERLLGWGGVSGDADFGAELPGRPDGVQWHGAQGAENQGRDAGVDGLVLPVARARSVL